jgi:hypothetical protein
MINGVSLSPCALYTYGENEDYSFYVGIPAPGPTTVVASPTAVCNGSSATLTANGIGPFMWSNGGTGSVTVVSPSVNANFYVSAPSGSCVSVNGISLSVNAVPSVSAASNSNYICSGNSATLTAAGAAGYTWNPGGLTGASVIVNPGVTTIYTVTGNNGTCTAASVLTQSVSTPVQATSGSSILCSGSSVTLTATGNTNYTWTPGGTGATISVSPSITTVYSVAASDGTCSSFTTLTQSVTTTPTVSVASSDSILCAGSQATLTGSGAVSYTWNPGGAGNMLVITPTTTTIYTLTGSVGPCSSTATITQLVNICTTVKNNFPAEANVTVFPNPFNEWVTIKSDEGSDMEMINIMGQTVYAKQNCRREESIHTDILPKGIYFLRVSKDGHSSLFRIFKN